MRKIKEIVIHCTDSQDSLDIGVKEVNRWHEERGWKMIGYHYLIRRDGRIERGRPDSMVGAHVKGHNKRSLAIVWVGRVTPTASQYNSLFNLAKAKMNEYRIDITDIKGHNEYDDDKTCPNLDMNKVRGQVLFKDVNEAKKGVHDVPDRSPIWEKVRKSDPSDG